MKSLSFLSVVTFSLILAACGGGGGGGSSSSAPDPGFSGNTSRATVDDTNAEGLSRGVVQSASRVEVYDQSSLGGLRAANTEGLDIHIIAEDATDSFVDELVYRYGNEGLAARIDTTIDCDISGTARLIFPTLTQGQPVPQTGSGTLIYNDCSDFDFPNEAIDGTVDIGWNGFDETRGFQNFTVTINVTVTIAGRGSQRVVGTITCSNFGATCTSSIPLEDFTGEDGTDYRVENVEVTGNASSGYNMTARVYHETYGYVDIVATGLILCSNGNIQAGSIQVTDATGGVVLTVSFSNCDDYTVTFDGVSTVYPQ